MISSEHSSVHYIFKTTYEKSCYSHNHVDHNWFVTSELLLEHTVFISYYAFKDTENMRILSLFQHVQGTQRHWNVHIITTNGYKQSTFRADGFLTCNWYLSESDIVHLVLTLPLIFSPGFRPPVADSPWQTSEPAIQTKRPNQPRTTFTSWSRKPFQVSSTCLVVKSIQYKKYYSWIFK